MTGHDYQADMLDDSEPVSVRITPAGVEVTRDSALFSYDSIDWKEIEEITIETNLGSIKTDGKKGRLPLEINDGTLTIHPSVESKDKNDAREIKNDSSQSELDQVHSDQAIIDVWNELTEYTSMKYEGGEVIFPSDESTNDIFSEVIQYLFNNEYLSMDKLPIQTPKAQKNYVLNTEPADSKGNRLPKTREPIPGVYFDEKTGRSQKEYYVEYIVENIISI